MDYPKDEQEHKDYQSLNFLENEENATTIYCPVFQCESVMKLSEKDRIKCIVNGFILLQLGPFYLNILPSSLIDVIIILLGDFRFISLSSVLTPIEPFESYKTCLTTSVHMTFENVCSQLRRLAFNYFNTDINIIHIYDETGDEKSGASTSDLQLLKQGQKYCNLQNFAIKMNELQHEYHQQMNILYQAEIDVLTKLNKQYAYRDQTKKIHTKVATFQHWSTAKLDYVIFLAADCKLDDNFANDSNKFLITLQSIQTQIRTDVNDNDDEIDVTETELLNIRHEMSKLRRRACKKIYDLNKEIECKDALDIDYLGHRRLDVSSASGIDRERRWHSQKIVQQLNTLSNQITILNHKQHENNPREIIEIQLIMSNRKLKAFFVVFMQTFNQSICDIMLCYQNLNCLMNDKNMLEMKLLCMEMYGIKHMLQLINVNGLTVVDKIRVCMTFIKIAQNACLFENKITNDNIFDIDSADIYEIILIIGRKLCINHQITDQTVQMNDNEIPNFAQIKVMQIFEAIIKAQHMPKLFDAKPLSALEVAVAILQKVFNISVVM